MKSLYQNIRCVYVLRDTTCIYLQHDIIAVSPTEPSTPLNKSNAKNLTTPVNLRSS